MEYMMDYSSYLMRKTPDDGTMTIPRLLNKQLADTLDLRSQARQSYFNVRGLHSQELRSLFDGLSRDLRQFADLIAERINRVGGYAVATVRSVAHESGLRDYPVDAFDSRDQLEALLSSYSRYELDTQQNMRTAGELGDSGTVELLQSMLVSVENNLWFLEAYLEGVAVGLHGRKLPAWTSTFPSPTRSDQKQSVASSGLRKIS
jgi:starvation-inducible DNA-binding protein